MNTIFVTMVMKSVDRNPFALEKSANKRLNRIPKLL